MKLNKPLLVVLLSVLTILAIVISIPAIFSSNSEYDTLLKEARNYSEKNLCEKAMNSYDKALSIKDSLSLRVEMAENYRKGFEDGEFGSYYQFSNFLFDLIDAYRKEPLAYEITVQSFFDFDKLEDCVQALYQAEDQGVNSEKIEQIRNKVRYLYSTSFSSYEDIVYTPEETYLIKNDKYSFLNSNIGSFGGAKYEYATPMLNRFALVKTDEYAFLLSSDLVREAYFPYELTESTGVGDSLIACKIDEVFSYYDLQGNKLFGSFEYAGRFANGVAPVKSSEGWYVIGTDGKQIGDLVFEDIIISQTNDCSQSGIIIAKTNGKYKLYDCGLNKVSDIELDNAEVFLKSNELAAFEIGGKWGFINSKGEIIIEAQYDQARSFSNGLAGVRTGESWSFINEKNEVVINGNFSDVNYFNANGYCFVKSNNYWYYLLRYYNR